MAWHLNKYVTNEFNFHASVSIDTVLYTYKIRAYDIEYSLGTCLLARDGRTLVFCSLTFPYKLFGCLRLLLVWHLYVTLIFPSLDLSFDIQEMLFRMHWVFLCVYWPPSRVVCTNREVVVFQHLTGTTPGLGSVPYCYISNYLSCPTLPAPHATQFPSKGASDS